jgi:hypothetical protein
VGAARDLRDGDEAGAGQRLGAVLGQLAREGPGHGQRAGAVAGRKAGLLLRIIVARRRLAVFIILGRKGAGAVDPVLHDILGPSRQQVGRDHSSARPHEAAVTAQRSQREDAA